MSSPWHHSWLYFALALLCIASVRGEESTKTPVFAVRTARGDLVKGTLGQLSSGWSVRLGEADGPQIAGAEVLSVRRLDIPLPPLPMDNHLILANGDRIPFRQLRLVDERFHLCHTVLAEGKDASVPLSAVSVLWYIAPDKTLDEVMLRRQLTTGKRTHDIVCLRNGDIVSGVLTSLDAQSAMVEVDKRRVTVKTAQLSYIAFNTELTDSLQPKGTYARLILRDNGLGRGGRFSIISPSADATTLTAITVFGARLRVSLRDVVSLEPCRGAFVYLSDLKESKYGFVPFLDAAWPFVLDGNVVGHDLLLAGSTYDKGIGMHSRSRLSYRLSGAYRRFETLAGLDDRDGKGGAVHLRVLADGDVLFDRAVSSRDGAVPVSVDLNRRRELTLEVDFGMDGDVRDVVDWADARLVK